LYNEIFSLSYYSNGGFTFDVVYQMPTILRKHFIKKLQDVKKSEKKELDEINAKTK